MVNQNRFKGFCQCGFVQPFRGFEQYRLSKMIFVFSVFFEKP